MKVCANLSEELLLLIKAKSIDLDLLKTTLVSIDAGDQEIFRRPLPKPLILHGLGTTKDLGTPRFMDHIDLSRLNEIIHLAGTPYLSVHLSVRLSDLDEGRGPGEKSAAEFADSTLRQMVDNIEAITSGTAMSMHLENVSCNPSFRPSFVMEPSFMADVLEESGSYLLLDTAHARCAAYRLSMDPWEYINQLPLYKVREIHTSGPKFVGDKGLLDLHAEMVTEDYDLLQRVLENTPNVEIVTLEYGGLEDLSLSVGSQKIHVKRSDQESLQKQLKNITSIVGR